MRVTQHDPRDGMIPVHWFQRENHSTANCYRSVKQAPVSCEWLSLVVLRFHGLGFYCDVLLKRRLVICEVDVSTISHSSYFSSAQKIFLQCNENETKGKCYTRTHFTDSQRIKIFNTKKNKNKTKQKINKIKTKTNKETEE